MGKYKWASRKSQWPDMQWYKEEIASATQKAKHAWVDELPSVLWS
jgi:hypothetical protein